MREASPSRIGCDLFTPYPAGGAFAPDLRGQRAEDFSDNGWMPQPRALASRRCPRHRRGPTMFSSRLKPYVPPRRRIVLSSHPSVRGFSDFLAFRSLVTPKIIQIVFWLGTAYFVV